MDTEFAYDYDVKIFLSLSTLECGPQKFNSREIRLLSTFSAKFNECDSTFEKTRIHFKGDVFAAVAVVAKVPYCLWRNFSAGGIVLCEVILRCDQRCNISKRENERTHSLFLSVLINYGA